MSKFNSVSLSWRLKYKNALQALRKVHYYTQQDLNSRWNINGVDDDDNDNDDGDSVNEDNINFYFLFSWIKCSMLNR